MKFLTAVAFLGLASCALSSGVAPYLGAALHPAPLALGGVAHYATVPVGRAVAYGSTINHGSVVGVGVAPYGYRYGLGLAAHAPVAAVKYGVAAAPLLGGIRYGVAAPHLGAVRYGVAAPHFGAVSYGVAAPVAAVKYGVAAAPVAAVKYGIAAAPLAAVKYGVHAAPLAVAPGYGLNKGYAL